MKALMSGKQRKKSQLGFTLVELMIAIAVSAMLMFGSMQLLSHMVVTSAQNRANTMAMLQVQYVGFWITEDVVQARPDGVTLGGAQGFPLIIDWTEWDGDENQVIYDKLPVEGEETCKLSREHSLKKKGESVFISYGMALVGESLDPAGTSCEWVTGGNVTDVLKLDVTAVGDPYATDPAKRHEVSRTYEINPRSTR